jgi:predicted nucleic acid-binding protein
MMFALVQSASLLSQQHELLTGDALVVAVMQDHGSSNIASADNDFDRVPGIMCDAPA